MIDTLAAMLETVWATPNLRLYLVLLWLLYLVLLGIWIVLQKREPVATLSWLMALALLPYVGFLIYFLLGPQKITRQRLRRSRTSSTAARSSAPASAQEPCEHRRRGSILPR